MFNKLFSTSILKRGLERTVTEVFSPLIRYTDTLWRTGELSTAHQHFAHYMIRQKLIVGIDALPLSTSSVKKYLLVLPDCEINDLRVLIATYLIRSRGYRTYSLRKGIRMEELQHFAADVNVDYLIVFGDISETCEEAEQKLKVVAGNFSFLKTFLVAQEDLPYCPECPDGIQIIRGVQNLQPLL